MVIQLSNSSVLADLRLRSKSTLLDLEQMTVGEMSVSSACSKTKRFYVFRYFRASVLYQAKELWFLVSVFETIAKPPLPPAVTPL
jgi:hypothetical protein